MTSAQSTLMLIDPSPSRAGSLPQLFRVVGSNVIIIIILVYP
ncbi:hypothetical protein PG5_22310 [Pseudomonas sp. G5(2012)]|nr:hypothetical protein PG5_22310 [Pseudomonas sp. G5(2012)]